MVFSGEWEISDKEAEAPATACILLTQARDLKKCKTCLGCVLPKKGKISDCCKHLLVGENIHKNPVAFKLKLDLVQKMFFFSVFLSVCLSLSYSVFLFPHTGNS